MACGKSKMHCVKCKTEFIPVCSTHKYCVTCKAKLKRMNLLLFHDNAYKGTVVYTLGADEF